MRLEDARETLILIEVVATWVDIYGKSECKHKISVPWGLSRGDGNLGR